MRRVYRVLISAVILAVLTFSYAAAGTTATLHLSLTVPKTVAISVESTPEASNLNFIDRPEDVLVGVVREMSNSYDGYTVHLSSDNAASSKSSHAYFTNSTGSSSTIPYDLTYGGNKVEFSEGSAKVMDYAGEPPVGEGVAREVRVSSLSYDEMPDPGSYSDTLTFTIAAK